MRGNRRAIMIPALLTLLGACADPSAPVARPQFGASEEPQPERVGSFDTNGDGLVCSFNDDYVVIGRPRVYIDNSLPGGLCPPQWTLVPWKSLFLQPE